MGKLVAQFMEQNPDVEVHLESTNRRVDVIREAFDIAVRIRRPPLETSDLVMRQLGSSVQRMVASPALLLRFGAVKEPADLQGWPSLDFGLADRNHIWSVRNESGAMAEVSHHPRLVTDDLQILHTAALSGVGTGLLPWIVVKLDIEAGRLIDLLPGWASESWLIHAVFPSRRGLLPSVRAFVDFIASGSLAEDES
jgi:DNA-binding transcriptional LysR family regulator